ncbi:uncharacterized protein LOC124976646 [Sciurus carolinensis]|uniref:uncharacterized protein LOC124976646 n=1 Tax=Sciurus carolinensis TaxID=30640 RepID=UPI001FB2350C|nr:uncharacterized protein LOC124976646 [Sciurus carolinensis]
MPGLELYLGSCARGVSWCLIPSQEPLVTLREDRRVAVAPSRCRGNWSPAGPSTALNPTQTGRAREEYAACNLIILETSLHSFLSLAQRRGLHQPCKTSQNLHVHWRKGPFPRAGAALPQTWHRKWRKGLSGREHGTSDSGSRLGPPRLCGQSCVPCFTPYTTTLSPRSREVLQGFSRSSHPGTFGSAFLCSSCISHAACVHSLHRRAPGHASAVSFMCHVPGSGWWVSAQAGSTEDRGAVGQRAAIDCNRICRAAGMVAPSRPECPGPRGPAVPSCGSHCRASCTAAFLLAFLCGPGGSRCQPALCLVEDEKVTVRACVPSPAGPCWKSRDRLSQQPVTTCVQTPEASGGRRPEDFLEEEAPLTHQGQGGEQEFKRPSEGFAAFQQEGWNSDRAESRTGSTAGCGRNPRLDSVSGGVNTLIFRGAEERGQAPVTVHAPALGVGHRGHSEDEETTQEGGVLGPWAELKLQVPSPTHQRGQRSSTRAGALMVSGASGTRVWWRQLWAALGCSALIPRGLSAARERGC